MQAGEENMKTRIADILKISQLVTVKVASWRSFTDAEIRGWVFDNYGEKSYRIIETGIDSYSSLTGVNTTEVHWSVIEIRDAVLID